MLLNTYMRLNQDGIFENSSNFVLAGGFISLSKLEEKESGQMVSEKVK